MERELKIDRVIPITLIIIASILVTASLYIMKSVLIPFTFSIFLYMLILPVVIWIEKITKTNKTIALIITFCILMLIFIGLTIGVGLMLQRLVNDSGEYQTQVLSILDHAAITSAQKGYPIDITALKTSVEEFPIMKYIAQISKSIVKIIGNIILVFIFTLFILMGKKDHKKEGYIDAEIHNKITHYIFLKSILSIISASICGLVLFIGNVKLAILFGFFTFFLHFIPNIGAIIAVLLPIPVILLQFNSIAHIVLIIASLGTIQFIIGHIVEPKVMGNNLGLHPAIVLLAFLFWGFIWGIPGMFLSVPITAIIKLILSRSLRTKKLANLLEGHFH